MATTIDPDEETAPDAVEPSELEIYRTPDDKVRPGDIVRLTPVFKSLKVIEVLGNEFKKGEQRNAQLHVLPQASRAVREGTADGKLVVGSRLIWGVLVTRGCDVEKSPERQVALLRPLKDYNTVDHANIIDGKSIGVHYLPASTIEGVNLGESVIDFRFVTTLHIDLFKTLDRPISLTREALLDVYFGWMQHTMGARIPATAPCPRCQTPVDVFQLVEEAATPQADY